jgi:hypothetical protein
MKSARILDDGHVAMPFGSASVNRGTIYGRRINRALEILLLGRNSRRRG